jgi:BMFP domain-containing protein YqiC
MSLNDEQARQTRARLAELRSRLAALEQEYNRFVPPDGAITLGRRAREAHQNTLTEIAVVKSAIEQCEKELGDA